MTSGMTSGSSERPQGSASRREEWREGLLIALALPFIGALAFFILGCFRIFTVPSGSMLPTLGIGSHVVVSHLATGFSAYTFDYVPLPLIGRWPQGEIARGDLIVFRAPNDHDVFFIKRVIGLPGDTVGVHQGRLVLNGVTVAREAMGKVRVPSPYGDGPTETAAYIESLPQGSRHAIIEVQGDESPGDETPDYTVPADHVFVLGDNRDNSSDSRHELGMVPTNLINGKVVMNFRLPGTGR